MWHEVSRAKLQEREPPARKCRAGKKPRQKGAPVAARIVAAAAEKRFLATNTQKQPAKALCCSQNLRRQPCMADQPARKLPQQKHTKCDRGAARRAYKKEHCVSRARVRCHGTLADDFSEYVVCPESVAKSGATRCPVTLVQSDGTRGVVAGRAAAAAALERATWACDRGRRGGRTSIYDNNCYRCKLPRRSSG